LREWKKKTKKNAILSNVGCVKSNKKKVVMKGIKLGDIDLTRFVKLGDYLDVEIQNEKNRGSTR